MRPDYDNSSLPVLRKLRRTLLAIALFSVAGNLLLLTGPLFMLQVYDRILPSGSVPTLVVLFGLVCVLYLFFGLFDSLRSSLFSRVAFGLEQQLEESVQHQWIDRCLNRHTDVHSGMLDLKTVRQFLVSGGPTALFDLPWVAVYIAVIFALHTWLGVLATIGACFVVSLTVIQEIATSKPLQSAGRLESKERAYEQHTAANVDAITAMGMVGNITHGWRAMHDTALAHSQQALSASQLLGSMSKSIRLLIQSGMLALGALFAIQQEISAGTLIAASILAGRALAPIDQLVANWRGFVRARMAVARLRSSLGGTSGRRDPLALPKPAGRLSVKNVIKLVPASDGVPGSQVRPLLQGLNFDLEPGDGLGIIGPSASGKSCLGRTLIGLWTPERGSIRLDGAPLAAWGRESLGKHLGYLPQNVQLFPGTVAQNISRFEADAKPMETIEAASLAGVHEIILNLPEGYETQIGAPSSPLSGGQAQRIALARAIFRTPPLVVLDEPNANLDADGETALADCVGKLRAKGSTVVVIAHRPKAINAVNKILVLNEGRQMRFGDARELLRDDNRQPDIHVVSSVQ